MNKKNKKNSRKAENKKIIRKKRCDAFHTFGCDDKILFINTGIKSNGAIKEKSGARG